MPRQCWIKNITFRHNSRTPDKKFKTKKIQTFSCVFIHELSGCRYRSNHRRCFVKKGVLRNFAKFTGKHLCFRAATLLKKSLWHRCFPVNFANFLKLGSHRAIVFWRQKLNYRHDLL